MSYGDRLNDYLENIINKQESTFDSSVRTACSSNNVNGINTIENMDIENSTKDNLLSNSVYKQKLNFDDFNNVAYYFTYVIDCKDINRIEKLCNNINKNEINNKNDIIFELYIKDLLTSECPQFIMENCTKYLNISSNLIKKINKGWKHYPTWYYF